MLSKTAFRNVCTFIFSFTSVLWVPSTVSGAEVLEEVIVTATRRDTNVQDTAAAITAMQADELAVRSITKLSDLAGSTPGLHISDYQGDTSIFIRGIGTPVIIAGNDSSTGTYVDGVYLSRAAALGPAFFDVSRIEVLRGPQGTLYGRNATGGAINIVSNRPGDEFGGNLNVTLGDYNLVDLSGAVDIPLGENVSGRIAIKRISHDGYSKVVRSQASGRGSDDVEDQDQLSLRFTIQAELAETTTLTLIADYFDSDDKSKVFTYASSGYAEEVPNWYASREGQATAPYFAFKQTGRATTPGSRTIFSDVDYQSATEISGVTLILDHSFEVGDLKVSANYKDTNPYLQNEFDLSDAFVNVYQREEDHEQWSVDVQFTSEVGENFNWVVGGSYFEEDNEITNNIFGDFWEPILIQGLTDLQTAGVLPPFPVVIPQTTLCCDLHLNGDQQTEAWAVFAEANWNISEKLLLTFGGRYSDEERDGHQVFELSILSPTGGAPARFAPEILFFPNAVSEGRDGVTPDPFGFVVAPVDGPESFDAFTPKLALTYTVNEDWIVYASAQRGFKSGGYNIGSNQRVAYEPEKIWAYEVGLKGDFLDSRLRLNSAVFHYDYTNLQAQDSVQNQPIIRNVGKARVTGFELETIYLVSEHVQLDASMTHLNAEFTKGELTEPLRPAPITQEPGSLVTDLDGLTLPRAPDWKFQVGLQAEFSVASNPLLLRLDYSWQSEIYYTVFNIDAASQDDYGVVNVRAEYQVDDRWRVAMFGKNISDESYFTNQILTGTVYGAEFVGTLGAPKTYGLEVAFNF